MEKMQTKLREDGGIEIKKGERVVMGRSTITGETMISLNGKDFYLLFHIF